MKISIIIACLILAGAIFTLFYPYIQSYFKFVDKAHEEYEETDISDRW